MKKYNKGDCLKIHKYKHDGTLHRCWMEATFIEENEDYMIFGNYKTLVVESEDKVWKTKEPAIMYFSKNNWFNIIGQLKKNGIYFYCNIASPFLIEEDTIKYIDYDLDLRVFPNGSFKVLDRGEYNYNKKRMNYSEEIDKIVKSELTILIEKARNKEYPFQHEQVKRNFKQYEALKNANIEI